MSSIMGDGRIDGWDIVQKTFPNVTITKGSGFIDKHYVVTFDDQDFVLSANATFNFYAQRRVGVLSIVGPKSDVASVTYNDTGIPDPPLGFSASATVSNPFFSSDLSWTANTEIDIDHYDVERAEIYPPDTNFALISSVEGTTFTDTLDEDITYYYRLYAVDESGFRSTPSEITYTTGLSPNSPPNPIEVLMPSSEGAINVLWKRPQSILFSKVASWELTWVRLNTEGSEISSTRQSRTIDKSVYFDRIEKLSNGELYKVTLKTVDSKGRKSDGIIKNVSPQLSNAPKDPRNILKTETELVAGSIIFNTSWTDGVDEYDPLIPYKYNIYLTVDGQQESIPINVPIGEIDEQIELYFIGDSGPFSIPQNTLVTLRFTSLSENGIESSGRFLRFVTADLRETLPVGNLLSDFDPNIGKITVTWSNQQDAFDIQIKVVDDNLGDDYSAGEIINESIGLVERYVFDAELNHTYTITVTPSNSGGIDGPSDVTVELTLISGGFAAPAFPSNVFPTSSDRQVSFDWIPSTSLGVVSYKIYYKIGTISIIASDWTLLDTLPHTINAFEHFGLDNDQIYSYYITAVNLFGQESLHLPDGVLNLNFFEITPKSSGIVTEPDNVQLSIIGDDIHVTWNSLLEEFDGFTIFRSVGNLHLWQRIATVDRNTTGYLDENIPLVDGTVFYYAIEKTINDSDIVVQTSTTAPESSIFIGEIVLGDSTFTSQDSSDRREIKDLIDPISEFTNVFLLKHVHKALSSLDPDRIELDPELIVTNWETVDGRIFTTDIDISGTGHIIKIDGRFPSILFEIDEITNRIIFTEPITEVNEDTGLVTGTIPDIELRVLGVEEIQGILSNDRFNDIHTKQVAFGRINKEQMPSINHEGRIRERMLPKSYRLERFSDHVFIVPQGNVDDTKTFGDGTSFFAVIENDGLIKEVIDWDLEDDGDLVGFQLPSFSTTTVGNLEQTFSTDIAEVTDLQSFQSEKSYHLGFDFIDNDPSRWVRITTNNASSKPNPILDLKKRLRFKVLLKKGSLYLTLGVREVPLDDGATGDNGGVSGPIEWVGITEVIKDSNDADVPRGILVEPKPTWQEIEFDLERDDIAPFSDDSDGVLSGRFGVLEHIACTINPDDLSSTGIYDLYIDKLEQVDDVLVAGTSQGILLSRNFGSSWDSVRFVETPVHKFYKGVNNPFVWAMATNTVLLSVDPANWFETSGLTGVQFIRDIAEDEFGNMFVSTDKGVYWFETALINNFSSWRQTQPVTAFTTDCYGMYHNPVSSGLDEIWVSTEIGVYKTVDQGTTWIDSGIKTQGLPAFEFLNISSDSLVPNIIAITRKHVLRKLGTETEFSVLANFEVQHNIFDIWTMEFFVGHLYVSTGKGVFWNAVNELNVPNITATVFDQIFPKLNINGESAIAFGLNSVEIDTGERQLFICQENRLLMSDENNVISIKEQFPNKELPSFFADSDEVISGYVYNAFNNVLVFREPQPVGVVYRAVNLPRKIYLPINGGWSQTNTFTDAFIFVNGIPKWLDFKADESSILSELQVLQGKLGPIQGTLNTFNSRSPNAENKLAEVLSDITSIIEGGENGAAQIENSTIIQFLADYTRFLSLVTNGIVIDNGLDVFPKINIAGFISSQREPGSRAALLETKEDFTANNSTGINIETFVGEVDFLTVFTQTTDLEARQEYAFNKYDRLEITLFNANVENTGEFTHRELEDKMEAVNTGLSSHLSRSHYTNLIKAGIFLESNNNSFLDIYNASNIQSKFNASYTNDWYDIPNSTLDYKTILKVDGVPESRFANDTAVFGNSMYLEDRIWIATDSDILQYLVNTSTGELITEKTVRPGDGVSALFVWNIFKLNDDEIYVVAEEKESKVGHIFRTADSGASWTDLETINLPQQIYSFSIVNGNKVAGTEKGIYYSDNSFGAWFPGNLNLSPQLSDNSPSVDAFSQRVRNMETTTFLIAESDRWFYTSSGGIDWFALSGQITSNGVESINAINRFKNITWIGTDNGLYNDGNSILSDGISFGLQTELESSSAESSEVNVSDIATGSSVLYCCGGSKIYRFFDNEWDNYEVPNVSVIHKIVLIESDKDWLTVIGHNSIQTVDVTVGTGVFG